MTVALRYTCDADRCTATADQPLGGGDAWDVLGAHGTDHESDTVWIDGVGNLPDGWLAYKSEPRIVLCPVHARPIPADPA